MVRSRFFLLHISCTPAHRNPNEMERSMSETVTCARCEQEFDAGEAGCPACGHLRQAMPCAAHPDRQAEGQCVFCGVAVCEECNEAEGHYACAAHCSIPFFQGWAQVYMNNDDVEAQLIRDNLKAEGIDAEILSQQDRTFRVELGDLAPVRVLVPAFDYLDAAEVVAGHMNLAGEVAFACEQCGEPFEPGQDRCASCQAALPQSLA